MSTYMPTQEELAWLQQYHETSHQYPKPSVTVDLCIFTVAVGALKVLLIRRGDHPYKGFLALPGGYVHVGDGTINQGESIEHAAHRELAEETSLPHGSCHLEQFGVFGEPNRDPRGRVVSVGYLALVPSDRMGIVRAGDDAVEVGWYNVSPLDQKLAFDHEVILTEAINRLYMKATLNLESLLPLLPKEFMLSDLLRVYRAFPKIECPRQTLYSRFRVLQDRGVVRWVRGERQNAIYSKNVLGVTV